MAGIEQVGRVYLVGAGPGDPRLLTVRGLWCLRQADLVLYDGLVNPLLLRETLAAAERTSRVDAGDGRRLDQDEINRRLIEAARAGKTVVRLKGGDPFVFGRGSEEAAALAAAGIPFEVVPGVTAAVAAGAYAGFSFTHRDLSSAVAFVTGHEDPGKTTSRIDYESLAHFPGTLVFYMGLDRLPEIARSLIEHGRAATTPAAVICKATLPTQRTLTGTLADIAMRAKSAGMKPPSLIIVGDCIRQRENIAWFEQRPLFGQCIGITRPMEQAGPEIERCLDLGAQPVLMPLIQIEPPDDWTEIDSAIERLAEVDWLVFTSVNGVRAFLGRVWETGRDVRALSHIKLAAIGPATADALAEYHLRADVMPESYRSEDLAAALLPHVSGGRLLWPRASRGRDVLIDALTDAGAKFETVIAYRHVDAQELPAEAAKLLEAGLLDWILLSSPAIARRLADLLSAAARSQMGTTTRLAAISPVTADAARECGLPIAAMAETHTWPGMWDSIVRLPSKS
jgi:uroporphyrinogen III methyltransferase/synthase